MKTLLFITLLAALAVIALCYESHESMESYEMTPFINRRKANNFMSPQQRWRAKHQERVRERAENAPSQPMKSIGKHVMITHSVHAMPSFMDIVLPIIVISGNKEIFESRILESPFPEPGAWIYVQIQ